MPVQKDPVAPPGRLKEARPLTSGWLTMAQKVHDCHRL